MNDKNFIEELKQKREEYGATQTRLGNAERTREKKKKANALKKAENRQNEIDCLFAKMYEDKRNPIGQGYIDFDRFFEYINKIGYKENFMKKILVTGGTTYGKEFDEETGLYYYGARYMDPVASMWYGVDPLAEEYEDVSNYLFCHANPITLIDPTGAGDYYNKGGIWLGKDGNNNDKNAYLATSVNKNKKGLIISTTDKTPLNITNDVLNQYANTVAQESSGSSKFESYALASAIYNLSKYKNKSILSTLKTEGIYGFRDGGYKTDYKKNAEFSMEAVINALTNGKDYSNGAIRWDGFDLAAKGFNHPKPQKSGVNINATDFENFKKAWPAKLINAFSGGKYNNFSSDFHPGNHPATSGPNKGYILYSSSASYGRTLFWKANFNATRKVFRKGHQVTETYRYTY